MTESSHPCREIRALASLYLDGRLEADQRQSVQEHLRVCPACVLQVRGLQRLARVAQSYPWMEPPQDLFQSVRKTLHRRRQSTLSDLGTGKKWRRHGRRILDLAIAASVLAAAFFLGLKTGRDRLAGEDSPIVALAPASDMSSQGKPARDDSKDGIPARIGSTGDPARVEMALKPVSLEETVDDYREAGVDPVQLARAAYVVFGDLATIDRLREPLREPLVAAQLRHFDLDQNARRWLAHRPRRTHQAVEDLRPAVELIGRVSRRVAKHDARAQDWLAFQKEVVEKSYLPRTSAWVCVNPRVSLLSAGAPELLKLVGEVAPQIPETDRSSIAQLLSVKDAFVSGAARKNVVYAFECTRSGDACRLIVTRDLRPSIDFTIATSLSTAGLREIAAPFMNDLTPELERSIAIICEGQNIRVLQDSQTPHDLEAPDDLRSLDEQAAGMIKELRNRHAELVRRMLRTLPIEILEENPLGVMHIRLRDTDADSDAQGIEEESEASSVDPDVEASGSDDDDDR